MENLLEVYSKASGIPVDHYHESTIITDVDNISPGDTIVITTSKSEAIFDNKYAHFAFLNEQDLDADILLFIAKSEDLHLLSKFKVLKCLNTHGKIIKIVYACSHKTMKTKDDIDWGEWVYFFDSLFSVTKL